MVWGKRILREGKVEILMKVDIILCFGGVAVVDDVKERRQRKKLKGHG